jgi:hypothetical protein
VAIANPLNNGSKAIEKSYVAETGSRSYRCMLQSYASIFLTLFWGLAIYQPLNLVLHIKKAAVIIQQPFKLLQ